MRTTNLLPPFLALLSLHPSWSATFHVSPEGNGRGGLRWDAAFSSVGDAIVAAASGDAIWIRKGTYFESIELKDGLSLYGGFEGTESSSDFDLRDPVRNVTTLDGTGTGLSVITVLDRTDVTIEGLDITGGRVNDAGGLNLVRSSVKVTNSTIHSNSAIGAHLDFGYGGGLYGEKCSLVLENNEISNNDSDDGCGIYLYSATATIRHSTIVENVGGILGGGIYAADCRLVIENSLIGRNVDMVFGGGILLGNTVAGIIECAIIHNQATNGAGCYILGSTELCVLSNCLIDGNIADGQLPGGGGINCSGPVVIQDCTITNNVGGYNGGAIYAEFGPTLIERCRIEGNRAREGGGLTTYGLSPSIMLRDSVIKNNTAEKSGGGINAEGSALMLEGCVISENIAEAPLTGEGGGGGIYSQHIHHMKDCTISNNRADGFGGGIRAYGNTDLENCLIYNNMSTFRGGGLSTVNFEPLIRNCVFANNTTDLPGSEIFVGLTIEGLSKVEPVFQNCIIWSETSENLIYTFNGANPLLRYCDIRGGWPGEGNIDADPLFVDLSAANFRLRPNSPCIDSASTAGPLTDLDGNPRPVDVLGTGREGAGAFDMGAFEFQIPPGDLNSNGLFEPLDLFLFQRDWMKTPRP